MTDEQPHEHVWTSAEAYVYECPCGARKDAITGGIQGPGALTAELDRRQGGDYEFAWLIEHGPEATDPPVYYATYAAPTKWTPEATTAVRFDSRDDADTFIARQFAGTGIVARSVEHGFLSAFPTPVRPDPEPICGFARDDLYCGLPKGHLTAHRDRREGRAEQVERPDLDVDRQRAFVNFVRLWWKGPNGFPVVAAGNDSIVAEDFEDMTRDLASLGIRLAALSDQASERRTG